jgi:hypothetical protein
MMLRRVLTTTVLLMGMSVAAHADILATGLLYADSSQNAANCFLFNAGTGPVTVSSKQIIREDGTPITLNFQNSCGTVLAPGRTCGIGGSIGNAGYQCKFVISPSAADVRGNFQIRGPGGSFGVVLTSAELR